MAIKYYITVTQMIKTLYLLHLCVATVVISEEVYYNVRPSLTQSQYYGLNHCSNTECMGHDITLSQLIHNSSYYFMNSTRLIFSPGNYYLEFTLVVENIHSFSMLSWTTSSKAGITCGPNATFEFRNVSTVTVSGLEFISCSESNVVSIGQFQLENSRFFGNVQATVSGTVFRIEESSADFDRVAFVSIIDTPRDLSEHCRNTISIRDRMIGILLNRSNVRITQNWFEGNNVGFGAVIYDDGSNYVMITNTTFVNNSASNASNKCNISGAIVYASSNESTIQVYNSIFVGNVGVVIFGENSNMLISHTILINNEYNGPFAAVYVTESDANLTISHSTFTNNTGSLLHAKQRNLSIVHCEFIGNRNGRATVLARDRTIVSIAHTKFNGNTGSRVFQAENTNISITHSEFIGNENGFATLQILNGMSTSINHCKFINNSGSLLLEVSNTSMISVSHSKFIDNTETYQILYLEGAIVTLYLNEFINNKERFTNVFNVTSSLVYLDGVQITVHLSKFINNSAGRAIVYVRYFSESENLTDNVFIDNSAAFEVFISLDCRPGLGPSLGSSHCIQCSDNWHRDLIGIVVAAFIAGISLVIFMLALNMTVAIGTLNGILFYANIVAANADTYFLPFKTPNFVTVFISWLNLDIGFDVCFFVNNESEINYTALYKTLIQLAFPAYVNILVIIVIVASECSSNFAKMISKGNPVAVLATMILLSYSKFFNAILGAFSLLYLQSGYGSRNVLVSRLGNVLNAIEENELKAITYFLIIISILILLLCVIYSALVFSWQWLLRYENKAIFKWVRYQKLRHFLEPYHAPYTAKYRYWTGLLLFVRVVLYLISVLNTSLDPRVDLMAVIFVIGGLIFLKGVNAKRFYKNWPLDVMETAIYFNLVAFSALTWYNLDSRGDQVAVAYTSVMIIFILLLGVIVFHVLRYTRLYRCSFVEKAFMWTSSKVMEKSPGQEGPNDAPEELDGYQLKRSAADDQNVPTVTYSIVEMGQCEEES